MNYHDGQTLVLANVGFGDKGPSLLINDVFAKTQERYYPLGKTFSLKKGDARYCVGSFDLAARTRQACQLSVELPADSRDDMCPSCRELTGFNPAFYNTPSISPQQRAYNNTPHFVYLAYFSPQHIKAGISSEMRGNKRLLEQGARAALIVGRFDTAEKARELEARLCADPGVFETMRSSKKAELLVEVPYDFGVAQDILCETARRFELEVSGACLDLDASYFAGRTPTTDELQIPQEGPEDTCGGNCIGMMGSLLVFEQVGINYVVSIKEWESWGIELFEDEVLHAYSFEPMQMSLL